MERIRKINVNELSEDQFQNISLALSDKIKSLLKKYTDEMNKYLNVYGLEVLLAVRFVKQGEANLIKEELKNYQQDDPFEGEM